MRARCCIRKPISPPEMIAVGMAEDQTVDPRGIDFEQIGVAQNDLRGIAEIQHVLRVGASAVGFEMQRKAQFAGQGRYLTPRHLTNVLDGRERVCRPRQEAFIARIDDDSDGKPIDYGRGEGCPGGRTQAHG